MVDKIQQCSVVFTLLVCDVKKWMNWMERMSLDRCEESGQSASFSDDWTGSEQILCDYIYTKTY